ncbi:MAG: nucleotidyltransferase domain-containing protein [Candidatus Bathyarchaeota archaeon]|nr:MAG: nucleotidyltransferase domain-containing protein [Candidatus Bathyarchaeota archaeon]
MPKTVELFTERAISRAKEICGKHLVSIYLFGGLASGEFTDDASDVDLLFIIDDRCPQEKKGKLEQALRSLEAKHGFLRLGQESPIFSIFASRTALFKSHFILRLQSLKNMDYVSMFYEGKGFDLPLGRILFPFAPSKLVIRNILTNAKILHGIDSIEALSPPSPSWSELNKAFLASLLMSIFGIFLSFITKSGSRFSMEAFKWYILNTHSFFKGSSSSVKKACTFFRTSFFHTWIITSRFCKLRKCYSRSFTFNFIVPFYITLFHMISSRSLTAH